MCLTIARHGRRRWPNNCHVSRSSEEVIEFGEETAVRHKLNIVTMQFAPEECLDLLESPAALARYVSAVGAPRRIALTPGSPDLAVTSPFEFVSKNQRALVIDVGTLQEGKLRESAIYAKTGEEGDIKMWRDLVADLRKRTHAGLWGLNSSTGAKHFYKQNRYTAAVAREAEHGLQLVPLAGSNRFFVEEPVGSNV